MNIMPQVPVLAQDQDIAFSFWAKDIPQDSLLVTAFAVDEAIFGMTKIEVMLSSEDSDIDLEAMIDTSATLTIHHKYQEQLRHFSGVVVEAEIGDEGHHRTAYRVVLLPSIARLDHGSDCRIFQGQSVPDIVRTIFSEHDIHDVDWQLQNEHLIREYATAYRETHLGFIERILAEEGIFYYFEHDKEGKHKLVLCDMPETLPDCVGAKELEYNATASTMVKGVYCSSLAYRKKLRSTTFVQRDYSFKNPSYSQEQKDSTSNRTGEKRDYEMYDYPGRYKQDAAGKPFTKYKLEATRVDAAIAYGIANAPLLITGHGFKLKEHPKKALNEKWRLLTIRHEGVQPQAFGEDGQGNALGTTGLVANGIQGTTLAGLAFGTTGSQSPGLLNSMLNRGVGLAMQKGDAETSNATLYACAFSAQPAQLPYRPPQVAKPLVDGPQVAIVVGPPGEQIYTDEHGRVKVHFPWDRHKAADAEDSSCWIRVSQPWGGGNWGNISIPRIGHEVIVEFLEGDPDQPIIMGRTYHANNHTPYQLPAHKTKMAIRSDTHKGDGGFNELSFEDENGQENMFLHAEKDQTIKVKNNQTQRVDANAMQTIGQNQAIEVGNNVNHQVGGGMNMVIGAIGSAAANLAQGSMAPLMANSAALLQDGINVVMQAASAAAATAAAGVAGAGSAAGGFAQAAGAAVGATSTPKAIATTTPSIAPLADVAGFASEASQFSNLVGAGGVLSSLSVIASGFDKAREGINDVTRFDLRTEGGVAMAGAGADMASSVGGLVGGGILNQMVSKFQNVSTGIAVSEQVGSMKASTIGHASMESIGHTKKVHVGQEHENKVGKLKTTSVGEIYNINVGNEFVLNVGSKDNAPMVQLVMNAAGELIVNAKGNVCIYSEKTIELGAKNINIMAQETINLNAAHIGLNDSKPE